MLFILIILLTLAVGSGGFGIRNGEPYGVPGISIGIILLCIIIVLLITGRVSF
jgi:hypothetical protein